MSINNIEGKIVEERMRLWETQGEE